MGSNLGLALQADSLPSEPPQGSPVILELHPKPTDIIMTPHPLSASGHYRAAPSGPTGNPHTPGTAAGQGRTGL